MLTKLAIWYLRKRKKSVVIGCRLNNGKVTFLERDSYIYDNKLGVVVIESRDGTSLSIPEGKFKISK